MSQLTETVANAQGEHRRALQWFAENAGKTIPWSVIKAQVDSGFRLVNQAKGIYKPRYTEYALSVRQTLDGPYADKDVEWRPDGSWVYPYFQENPDPAQRDREATNRGLMHCMEDDVPIGVLLQTTPKPGVQYRVLGLALVTDWQDGYFILEGFSDTGEAASRDQDAAHDRAVASTQQPPDFQADSVEDARERQIAEIIRRRGQGRFRAAVMAAYGRKCAVTDCDAAEALEAAHIIPYQGSQTDHIQNGLLLRADLHSLFDLGLFSIDPETLTIILSDRLKGTTYDGLSGRTISIPHEKELRPSHEALARHLKWSGLKA
jgi:putative restriction endonuclease